MISKLSLALGVAQACVPTIGTSCPRSNLTGVRLDYCKAFPTAECALDADCSKYCTSATYDGCDVAADVQARLARAGAKTGSVMATLSWDYNVDVDLLVTPPDGGTIYYNNNRTGNGSLDIDNNGGNNAVESIYWPHGQAPKGPYEVKVEVAEVAYFRGEDDCPYVLAIFTDGKPIIHQGTITKTNSTHHYKFNYPDNGSSATSKCTANGNANSCTEKTAGSSIFCAQFAEKSCTSNLCKEKCKCQKFKFPEPQKKMENKHCYPTDGVVTAAHCGALFKSNCADDPQKLCKDHCACAPAPTPATEQATTTPAPAPPQNFCPNNTVCCLDDNEDNDYIQIFVGLRELIMETQFYAIMTQLNEQCEKNSATYPGQHAGRACKCKKESNSAESSGVCSNSTSGHKDAKTCCFNADEFPGWSIYSERTKEAFQRQFDNVCAMAGSGTKPSWCKCVALEQATTTPAPAPTPAPERATTTPGPAPSHDDYGGGADEYVHERVLTSENQNLLKKGKKGNNPNANPPMVYA